MSDLTEFDLGAILSTIKPSMVSPYLADISGLSNDKKIRKVSELIVRQMVTDYNKSEQARIPKLIIHDGETTEVRFFDIEPLLTGIWPSMSLVLLHLSYGEQTVLIDALYPKPAQFTAKIFAATFTKASMPIGGSAPITVKQDADMIGKVDSANAGIAMIISMMKTQGYREPHPDNVNQQLTNMNDLVDAASKEASYRDATKRAKSADKHKDGGMSR